MYARSRQYRLGQLLALLIVLASACATQGGDVAGSGSSDAPTEEAATEGASDGGSSEASSGGGGGGSITVGSANFPEQLILGNMYAEVLEEAGFTVERELNLGSREVIYPSIESGELDVLPEYLGSLYNFLTEGEGEVLTEVEPLVEGVEAELAEGLELLEPSDAQDQDALAVTQETAEEFDLQTVSDLAPIAGELVAGGPPEEETRRVGLPGLEEVYGITFMDFLPLDTAGPQTVQALQEGRVDVARVFSTSSFIEENGFVVLEEDMPLIPGENITPLVRSEVVDDALTEALNSVSEALTTEALTELNARVELEREDPEDVAVDFLVEQGLIEG